MWKVVDNSIYRKFEFRDFVQALTFMNLVGLQAEAMQHHPLWRNEYNVVEIWLTTHDAGHIVTEKDRELSEKIDSIFRKFEG